MNYGFSNWKRSLDSRYQILNPSKANVILLSILVAILSSLYEDLQNNAKVISAWHRFDIILEGKKLREVSQSHLRTFGKTVIASPFITRYLLTYVVDRIYIRPGAK